MKSEKKKVEKQKKNTKIYKVVPDRNIDELKEDLKNF